MFLNWLQHCRQKAPAIAHLTQVECRTCSGGTISQSGSLTCTDCNAGKVQPETGQSECVHCNGGFYQPEPGNALCIPCPQGQFRNSTAVSGVECSSCTNFLSGSSTIFQGASRPQKKTARMPGSQHLPAASSERPATSTQPASRQQPEMMQRHKQLVAVRHSKFMPLGFEATYKIYK